MNKVLLLKRGDRNFQVNFDNCGRNCGLKLAFATASYKRVHDVLFLMYNKGFDPIRKNMNEERDIPSREEWKSLSSQIGTSYTSPMAIPGVEDVELLYNFEGQRYDCTCPVNEHCLVDVKGNNEQYVLRNTISGKELWLNSMVIHLAREHGLLYGDGSQYDICVEDFYESFMK